MQLVKRNGNNPLSGVYTIGNAKVISTVPQLETAVAEQTAGQFIFISAGTYQLTKSLAILLAGSGGGLIGIGAVEILGAAAADEAILVDPAVAAATFEYTFQNLHIRGGANKIGLNVANTATGKKVNLYINQVDLEDNGSGKSFTSINTDAANAIRTYFSGPGSVEGIAWTPKDTGDRLTFRNYDIDANLVAAVVDVIATVFFAYCKLPHEGITGGHANNVISAAFCRTEATPYVPVVVDASDFPGAFSATIL